ncbi:MAG: hypothetical protein RQ847_04275 [Wenzhouxiangellaceae bacterium]|nr:hypothetical protein [Wenzhouxiangellaceae bacterium]
MLALGLLGTGVPANANTRECILLGMLGGPLPAECTNAEKTAGDQAGPALNATRPAFVSISGLIRFADQSGIADSASVLTRNPLGVSFLLNTSDLEPDHAYTVWWVIFNAPQLCTGEAGSCTEDDLFNNPDVNASVVHATGAVSDFTGRARFSGRLFANGSAAGEVLFGPALVNPDAEIHLVVRSHGPVGPLLDEGLLEEALSTFGGGCIVRDEEGDVIPGTGPNECADVQFAMHRP